jgi:hypothetical protein
MAKALTASPSTIRRRRKKWLEALRSGDFKQAKGCLKKQTKGEIRHCCLGVAAELAGVQSQRDEHSLGSGVFHFRFQDEGLAFEQSQMLPEGGMEWLGLNTDDPHINLKDKDDCYLNLAGLNDRGWSFAKIADAIEEHGFLPENDLLTAAGRRSGE